MIGRIVGSFQLDAVLAAGDVIRASPLYPYALGLVLLGIFTKSAQFPFHFWLPHAMAAPTPVSAYLHSATMVKAGVFLLARLHPALAGTDLFFYTVTSIGAITVLLGAWHAIFQHDLKGVLAYSTISHLGLITMLFGLSTPMAVVAGVFHLINHAVFKASLFMAAGIIDHETGTRDMRKLGNLRRLMPVTSALAIIASLAMAGIPLLNGFLSKEMFFAVALDTEAPQLMRILASTAALLAGLLGVAYSLRFVHDTFFGDGPRELDTTPHEPPRWMRIPVEVLVLICVAVGIVPAWTVAPVLRAGATAILGDRLPDYSLALWHGVNLPLAMSVAGIVGGALLYIALRRTLDLYAIQNRSPGKAMFQWNLRALFAATARMTDAVTNGNLQRMLMLLVLSAVVVALVPFLQGGTLPQWPAPMPMPALGWMVWLLMIACALGSLFLYKQRLLAVLVLGGTGLAVSLTFVFLSAPDLALTQLLVEMVTLVLMLLAMNYLPERSLPERAAAQDSRCGHRHRRRRGSGGIGVYLDDATQPFGRRRTAATCPARSVWAQCGQRDPGGFSRLRYLWRDHRLRHCRAGGARLVAPRAHGTGAHHAGAADQAAGAGRSGADHVPAYAHGVAVPVPAWAQRAGRWLHCRAGAGSAIADAVRDSGAASVESRFGFDYIRLIGIGLLCALVSGAGSLVFGLPFLSSGHLEIQLPLLGELELASALGFDIGVYLVVFGAAMLMLSMMGTIKPSRTRSSQRGEIDPTQRSTRTAEQH